jgi:metal-sulfur cluster biosynthetic enzyme
LDETIPEIALPTVVADGRRTAFRSVDLRIHHVAVAVVFHPDWRIDYLTRDAKYVVKLWPPTPGLEIPRMPARIALPMRWITGPELRFREGVFGVVDLPPLTPGVSPEIQVAENLDR